MTRKYINTNEAWYYIPDKDYTHEITLNSIGDGLAEILFRWYPIGSKNCVVMEVFSDAMAGLPLIEDVMGRILSMGAQYVQPGDLVNILEALGFEDVTDRKSYPKVSAPKCPYCKRRIAP